MIDCTNGDIRDRLPELVNGRLAGEPLRLVQTHLVECDLCRDEVLLLERTRAILVFAAPRIDTSRIVQALPAPRRATVRRTFDWRIAASIAVLTVGGGSAAVMYSGWSSARVDSVAVATSPGPGRGEGATTGVDGSELSISGDLSGLTDEELRALVGKVDGIEAMPSAEVRVSAPLNGVVPVDAATAGRAGPS